MMHRAPAFSALAAALAAPPIADGADLLEFVRAPDDSFAWEVAKSDATDLGTVTHIDLTSQTWRGIPWTHQFRIYEPAEYRHEDIMLLFITGGSSRSRHEPSDDERGFALARACDARVAVLPQVPNQPLMGDRYEDDLIAHTFVRFLETGEDDWPLLQPMVKSAVRAMDAAQSWADDRGEPAPRFVVTGASKRGWTTWLTAAVDDRVAAIAPMVIPTLNMKANTEHQLELWGRYSEQIEDYTRRGLTETFDTPEGSKLWELVDPYFYLDRIDVPVLQINGTNDPYWTHDSTRFFWDAIRGPKHLVYLPNAGHGLDEHRDYATHGIGALVRHVAIGEELPKFQWNATPAGRSVSLSVMVDTSTIHLHGGRFRGLTAWIARSEDRDFRDDRWAADAGLDGAGGGLGAIFSKLIPRPDRGSVAALLDLTFEIDGLDYHLTTPIFEFRPDPVEDTSGAPSDANP